MPKVPYPYEVNGKLVTRNGSLIFFLIKPFLIAKFDYICRYLKQIRYSSFYEFANFSFQTIQGRTPFKFRDQP